MAQIKFNNRNGIYAYMLIYSILLHTFLLAGITPKPLTLFTACGRCRSDYQNTPVLITTLSFHLLGVSTVCQTVIHGFVYVIHWMV